MSAVLEQKHPTEAKPWGWNAKPKKQVKYIGTLLFLLRFVNAAL